MLAGAGVLQRQFTLGRRQISVATSRLTWSALQRVNAEEKLAQLELIMLVFVSPLDLKTQKTLVAIRLQRL